MNKKHIKMTASMPKTLIAQLDRVAAQEGRSRSSLMVKIITGFCVENGFLKRPA